MRWCQCIIGFERNKQAEGNGKNLSIIRLLKERNYGQTGVCYTKYESLTGRVLERTPDEVDEASPFTCMEDVIAMEESAKRDENLPF